ncbi:MAG: NUDIX hydrolase [Candidatus Woykebacteria bacterium]
MIKGQDYPGVTIVYFCHDGKGSVVMAKRGKNARDEHGRWDIGAGGLELGETIENTLRREIKEEYCTDVLEFEFLGFRDLHRKHNDQKTHWIGLDFKVLVDPTKVKIGEPHKFDDLKWFSFEELPNLPKNKVHSQFPVFWQSYRNTLI